MAKCLRTGMVKSMNNNNKKIKKFRIKTFKKNKITLTKLKANKKYYVKARAYVVANNKKTIYGEWTKIKAIKIKKK